MSNTTLTSRRLKASSIGDLVDIQAIEPDGLIISSDATYTRIIECQRVPNVVTADESKLRKIERGWADLCAAIPDNQSLCFHAQNDPIPIKQAMSEDSHRVAAAIENDLAHEQPDLAAARRRFLQAQTQSVSMAARGEQPAVAARYWVVVPYKPLPPVRGRLKALWTPSRGQVRTSWAAHQQAARESLRYTQQVLSRLAGMGSDPHLMGPVEVLAEVWERLHPAATGLPDFDQLNSVARIVQATDREQGAAHRAAIVDALCSGEDKIGIDSTDRRWLRHADGTLEEILHLGTPPATTTPWWLSHLLQVPLPCTVAVNISVGDRSRTRTTQRMRWGRLRAAVDFKQRRNQLVGSDEEDALAEARQLDQELADTASATVYKVRTYVSFRDPSGNESAFNEIISDAAKSFASITDARVVRGAFLNVAGFSSTLPIATDKLKAARLYAHRNIAHCVPLATASCGCPNGLILGISDPGATLERVNPFDPIFKTHVTLVSGPSGGGKTVATNALLQRAISQGMRGWIIDRSSTRSEHDDSRKQGHYEPLLGLVPGARKIQLGARGGDVICPWDVRDPATVTSEKLEFLLALHALLIGDLNGDERQLTSLEEGELTTAICDVYAACAKTGDRPRETLLVQRLQERAQDGDEPTIASVLHSLVARLRPYTEGGALEHIADQATTVDSDPPLTIFDVAGAPGRLVPALILTTVDHIDHQVQLARARRVNATGGDLGPWSGRCFLVVEEGWSLTKSKASGAWLNEYARRSRHYALWLIMVTQHFKDLDNEQGRALLENSQLRICFENTAADLEHARHPLGLTDTDIEAITELVTRPGLYSTCYLISKRGRGRVRIVLGDLEYWICSSDPERDQPARAAALSDAGGDPWKALRLLCTPSWHEQYHAQRAA